MILNHVSWSEFWSPVLLSLRIALLSSIAVLLLGLAAAWMMTRRPVIRGRVIIETVFMLPLVLPPTVVGFILLKLLGRKSWMGQWIETLFSSPIIFTWWAGVIASVVVAFPLVYQTMKVGFRSVDHHLEEAGRSIGASEWQVFRHITLPLVLPSLISAWILGFARSLGEFGATLMIAGNIPGQTQTVPTAIYVAVDTGNMPMAWIWTYAMIFISSMLLLATNYRARD
ncbi:molybdate ABC transporter permease subunit [Paenibacillus sp. JSM ZJ436]|uniref:molybdate ABC transporter permease subunit n=1 Tax=Paenibacillus sp. JSM ZJ436 TaxID=3376190 RepID=UPI0037B3AD49